MAISKQMCTTESYAHLAVSRFAGATVAESAFIKS